MLNTNLQIAESRLWLKTLAVAVFTIQQGHVIRGLEHSAGHSEIEPRGSEEEGLLWPFGGLGGPSDC